MRVILAIVTFFVLGTINGYAIRSEKKDIDQKNVCAVRERALQGCDVTSRDLEHEIEDCRYDLARSNWSAADCEATLNKFLAHPE